MAKNKPHAKPTETYIVMFHDVAVSIGTFCEVAGVDRYEFKANKGRSEVCANMLDYLHKTYKSGDDFRKDLDRARSVERAGWNFRKTEDTYGDSIYIKKLGRFEDSKVRKCLCCDKPFISNNGIRRCGECRDSARRQFEFGGQYANARNYAHR